MNISRLSPVILFGTLWGLSEVSFGNAFYANEFPYAAIVLNLIALVVLSVSRLYVSFTGSALFIGLIAMMFKIFHSPFFACHMLAILMMGVGFELAHFLFMRQTHEGTLRRVMTNVVATYAGFILFGVLITFVIRYEYWLINGSPNYAKLLNYIFVQGSLVALGSAVLSPLAMVLSQRTNTAVTRRMSLKPVYVHFSLIAISALIWAVA